MLMILPVSYGELYIRRVTLLDFLMVNFSFASIALLIVYFRRVRPLWLVAALVTYGGIFSLVGWRAHGMLMVLIGLWLVWRVQFGRQPGWVLPMAIIVAAFVIPSIRSARGLPGLNRFSKLADMSIDFGAPRQALAEMGGTIRTVAYTLEYVPRERPFALGRSYLWAGTRVIPWILPGRHPAATGERNPAQWLVWRVSPWLAERGGAMGYSMFAEPYFNFGWAGIGVVLFPMGVAIGKMLLWGEDRRDDPIRAYVIGVVFFWLIFGVRSDSSVLFRGIMWTGVIPYWVLSRKISGRSMRRCGVASEVLTGPMWGYQQRSEIQ